MIESFSDVRNNVGRKRPLKIITGRLTELAQVCLSFESIYLPRGISGKRISLIRQCSF